MPAMTERDDGTIRKVIKKRIRHDKDGIHIAGDIDAVISANVGKGGSHSSVSSSHRIVQRSTARSDTRKQKEPVDEERTTDEQPAAEKEVNHGQE